jgi:hypothetical protein
MKMSNDTNLFENWGEYKETLLENQKKAEENEKLQKVQKEELFLIQKKVKSLKNGRK